MRLSAMTPNNLLNLKNRNITEQDNRKGYIMEDNTIEVEPVAAPFADCYDDPTFEINKDGEIVGYLEDPEFWALEFLHIII